MDEYPVNRAFWPFLSDRSRYAVLYGGAGSGKSYAIAQKHIVRCWNTPRERFLVARKVLRTCRESTFRLLRDVCAAWKRPVTVNRSDLSLHFPNGSEIIHAGLDDVEKLKSIAAITSIWVEEATELSEDDFAQVDLRLRGDHPDYHQVVLSFNPIDARHWLKRRFIDEAWGSPYVLRTTYRDNRFAGADYAELLRTLPDENLRRIYAEGEWGLPMKGLIYPEWTTADDLPGHDDVCYGLDFGYNAPSALVRCEASDTDLWADELLYESFLTNTDLIERLKELIPDRFLPIYADAAEPDRIKEIHRAGFNIRAAEKNVNDGIDAVKRYALHVTRSSANLQAELRTYKWSEDRAGTILDKPVKFMDHALDALRYAVYSHYHKRVGPSRGYYSLAS